MPKHALIVGGTGEIGRRIVTLLSKDASISKITQIQRSSSSQISPKSKVIIASDLAEYFNSNDSKDLDVTIAYCCLGTGNYEFGKRVTRDLFLRIDRDLVILFAQWVRKIPTCEQFHVVSSIYADESSSDLYYSTKGFVENAIAELNFPSLQVYRPGLLICRRQNEVRIMERVLMFLAPLFDIIYPKVLSISADDAALCMAINSQSKKSQTFSNREMIEKSQAYKSDLLRVPPIHNQ